MYNFETTPGKIYITLAMQRDLIRNRGTRRLNGLDKWTNGEHSYIALSNVPSGPYRLQGVASKVESAIRFMQGIAECLHAIMV